MNLLSMAATFYRDGGFFMHLILACAAVIAAIVIERLIALARSGGPQASSMAETVLQAAARGDLQSARNAALSSQAPAARVAQAMLQRAPADEPTLQAVADDAATLELPGLTRRLPHLSMLANSATLLGLLGTVFGLMQAFASVQAADPAQRAAFLAAGISAALNTTAFGLLVAVPTLLLHGVLVSRVEALTEQTDEMAIRLGRALAQPSAALRSGQVTPLHAPRSVAAARPAASGPTGSV